MPQVDTSLYPQPAKPVNPLEAASQAVGLMGQMNQNKLLNLNLQGREAMPQLFQDSIDPATGQLDPNKLLMNASKHPATAPLAGPLAQEAQSRALTQIQTQKDQIGLALEQNKAVGSYMSRIYSDPTKKNITSVLAEAVNEPGPGKVTPQKAAELYLSLNSVEDSPEAIRKWLLPHQLAAMDAGQRLQTVYGSLEAFNTGKSIKLQAVSPVMGTATPVSEIPVTMGPGEAATPVTRYNPVTRQMEVISKEAFAQATAPGAGGGAASPAPGGGQQQPAPVASMPTEPPLGAAEAASVSAKGSAEAITGMRQQVAGSAERIYQLETALDALNKTATGPGTETRQRMQSMLTSFPGLRDLNMLEGIKEDAKYYDEANKKLTTYMLGQMPGLGQGTDDKLVSLAAANPSVHMSQAASKDLTKVNIGLEKYRIAQVDAFNSSQRPDEDYYKWSVQWNRDVDPRGFIVDMQDPKAREMLKKMPEAEKSRIVKTHKWAVANGYLH